jgi:hypothetical protein
VRDIRARSMRDTEEVAAYRQSFVDELALLGYDSRFSEAVVDGAEDCVAVVFEPTAIYDQTPGPKAGSRLDGRP